MLGARIARVNPLNAEIGLGFAVDLGAITVERARVRLSLDPLGPPKLTASAVALKVFGVLDGRGYMEMSRSGGSMETKGGIDVSLLPVKLRIAARVAVAQIAVAEEGPAYRRRHRAGGRASRRHPARAVGLGIYGFLGLFAMHDTRDERNITSLTPALTWLKDRA